MKMKTLASIAFAAALALPFAAQAQDSSYAPGSVWNVSYIKVEPGQFENYMDYLKGAYKKAMDYQVKEGMIVSWHIFAVNNRREGEPDLMLTVETRDYMKNADQLAMQKKVQEFLAMDTHKMDAGSGERKKMRTLAGSAQMQELVFK